MRGNIDLRAKLGKLVSSENEENWWRPELFKKYVRQQLSEEIKIIMPPPVKKSNYNCFVHVLGLQNDHRFIGEDGWEFTRNLGPLFDEMIKEKIFENAGASQVGDMILYRASDGSISHVGIMSGNDEVISKWSWGPLLKHKIWDVPDHYGDDIEFYRISPKAQDFIITRWVDKHYII